MKIDTFELRRHIFHICLGLLIMFLVLVGVLTPEILLMVFIFGIILSLVSKKYDVPVVAWFLDTFERKEKRRIFPGKGIIFFILGSLLVLQLFEKNVALASIMILTFGDPVSHFVGQHFGNSKKEKTNWKKYIEGTIAGTIVAFIAASFFVPFYVAFIAAASAMLVESIELVIWNKTIDDNLVIPLVAGVVIYLLLKI